MRTVLYLLAYTSILFSSRALADDDWTQKFPTSNPSSRHQHAVAYIGDNKIILFGGRYFIIEPDQFDDTWVYDLNQNSWTEKFPSSKPQARFRHGMAYIGDDKVLLFGGYVTTHFNDTWVYDLSDNIWIEYNPQDKPPQVDEFALAYIGDDKVCFFGGIGVQRIDETWIFDLSESNWTQKNPATKPSARNQHAMTYIGGL
jgi:N-acetylneuraminic acid mutarotase